VSVPRPGKSNLLAFPEASRDSRPHSPDQIPAASARRAPSITSSGDALLLGLLALLNESVDMDKALQDSLDMLNTAMGGCIGEIWLRSGDALRRRAALLVL